MSVAHPNFTPSVAMAVAAIATLAGCAMDDEATVRAELGAWVTLGDAVYFESRMECTAAVFETRSTTVHGPVEMAPTLPDGLWLIQQGKTVGFDLEGLSPNAVSEHLMSADLPSGLGLIASGVSGKNCMTDDVKGIYFAALTSDAATLIYAPSSNAVAVLDTEQGRVLFARGDV